jgi:hypothetical protein
MLTTQTAQSEWPRLPEPEAFVLELLAQLVSHMPPVQRLQRQMKLHADARLSDWLDHLVLVDGDEVRARLVDLGFESGELEAEPGDSVYTHPGGLFPRLLLRASATTAPRGSVLAAAVRVDQISDFLTAQRVTAPIEGPVLSPYRRALVWRENGRDFLAVERRGHLGLTPRETQPDHAGCVLRAYERWATRPRLFDSVREGMRRTLALAASLVSEVGTDLAAWAFIEAEQVCWQQRNRAAQVQKTRQDTIGLGWGNRDHCAFRSSREAYPALIEILETLGFRPRERFYAGAEAGWGAQVMEQQACQFAVFADVDLAPDEVDGDFAHRPLADRDELGTIGLWCALHGDALLAAGPHHFACRVDFDAATAGLHERGIQSMRPFSDFSYLKQAFTRGERWSVSRERLDRLLAAGRITPEQRSRFAEKGAVGSHLELIQRSEGFKGFNQQTVSDIIRRTDPRAG